MSKDTSGRSKLNLGREAMTTEAERLIKVRTEYGSWTDMDQEEVVALLRSQAAEIERLKKANNAFTLLTKSQEERISVLLGDKAKRDEAVTTLQSERDANSMLTAELDKANTLLRQALEAVEANHKHHQDYDDYGGYPESELAEQNTGTISAIKQHFGEQT